MKSNSVVEGLASRKAATAVLKAHVAVLKGGPMRRAIADALEGGGNLGGNERRFVAFATRELSRHLRWLNVQVAARAPALSKLQLPEDVALVRYALWRRLRGNATVEKVMGEVGLPGPIRPRGVPDAPIREALLSEVEVDMGRTEVERLGNLYSFPTWLVEKLGEVAPQGELEPVLEALNFEPTLTFRVHPFGTREQLLEEMRKHGLAVDPCRESQSAIVVSDGSRAIFDSRWMKQGRLQVMDLGSQLLGEFCDAKPGETAVDYCAGAGGKTLVLADMVTPSGRVYAWDESEKRLKEAKRRVGELKLRHVSFPSPVPLSRADVVLVDAPCSGTGTLGREPDQKWKLSAKRVQEFAATQLKIIEEVAAQMRKSARLIYGTCSLLRDEDEAVVEQLLKSRADMKLEATLRVWPHQVAGGGFFGARLQKV